MQPRIVSRPRAGFTTIESLIAAVVFLVGLVGLLSALVQARGATSQARRIMQATDVANDLAEQIHLWKFSDDRLADNATGPCTEDPLDKKNVLLDPDENTSKTYRDCMHGESMLTFNGAKFGGLRTPSFTDEEGLSTRFDRYYIVKKQAVREGVERKQIWVKVRYFDAGQPRVITTQTLLINMGGV
jgi:type II secretory pathway pseudopilin PulG